MKLSKQVNQVIALVLILVMLLPNAVFAGLKPEADKALVELVYMEAPDDTGTPEEVPLKTSNWSVGSTFFVGVRMTNLDNIEEAANGIYQFGTSVVYDTEYLKLEPSIKLMNQTQLINKWTPRMEAIGGIFEVNAEYEMALYRYANASTANDVTEAVSDAGAGRVHFMFQDAGLSDAGMNPNYTGSEPIYAAVIEFEVIKEPPANGKQVLDIVQDPIADKTITSIAFGQKAGGGSYEANPSKSQANWISNIMDFDVSAVDIFPIQYKFTYDANLTNDDNALLSIDATKVTPDLSTVNTGTVQKGQNFPSAMNLAVSAQTTTGTNVAVTGWYTDAACTEANKVDFSGTMNDTLADLAVTDNTIKLYAKWAAANIIKLDGNGGTATVDSTSVGEVSYTVPSGTGITLSGQGKAVPPFSRDGYTNDGWYRATGTNYDPTTDDSIDDPANEPINATETWYVKWTPANDADKVTVNFNGNADGVTVSPASVIVKKDASVNTAEQGATGYNMPADPTRTNYTFAGWNTAANGTGTAFKGTTPVVDNLLNTDIDGDSTNDAVTVYAQWTVTSEADEDKWTVNFHAYNPADNASVTVAPAQVEVDAKPGTPVTVAAAQMPNDPAVTGYELVGWYEAAATGEGGIYEAVEPKVEYTVGSTISKDMHVVAVFGKQASVTLHMQDGKDPETTKTLNGLVGDKIADLIKEDYADEAAFIAAVKPNYKFLGWDAAPQTTANKDRVPAKQGYATAAIADGDSDLYAWWQAEVAPVVATPNVVYTGSTIDWTDALSVQFAITDEDDNVSYTPAPGLTIDTDYTLEIWKGSDNSGTKLAALTDLKDAGEYYFKFTALNPELKFMANDGTFTIDKAKVKITVNSAPVKSDEQSTVQILPNITIQIGDGTPLSSTSADAEERAKVDAILKDLGAKYIPLTDPEKDYATEGIVGSDVRGDIRTQVESNPYIAGKYVVILKAENGENYTVDKSASPNPLNGKIDLSVDAGYSDATDFAFLTTVEANNHTVTFKTVTDLDTTPAFADIARDEATTTWVATVKSNTTLGATDNLVAGKVDMPDASTITPENYEFKGWYVLTDDQTYNDLKTAVEGGTATEFIPVEIPAEGENPAVPATVIDKNMTVVAFWTKSTDSGLKDPNPSDPDDHVGGLKLTKKVSTDTSDVVAITQLYDSDYTTDKDFTAKAAEGGNNNYYVRIDNKYDRLQITLETEEPGATVAVWKLADGKEVPTDTTGGEEIPMTDNVSGDIMLTVAIDAKANIFKIEVTAPDDVTKSEYYVFVQRKNVARIELNYGNSPYGLIMADNAITDKVAAKKAFVDNGNQFSDANLPAGADKNVIYNLLAWGAAGTDYNDPNVNLDRNDAAIFVYNKENFVDPGVTAIDSLGNTISFANVNRELKVDYMTSEGWEGLEDDSVTVTALPFETSEDGKDTYDMRTQAYGVRPGIYKLAYSFVDTNLPDGENTVTVERYVVVLSVLGDADNSCTISEVDASIILNYVGGDEFGNYKAEYLNVFKYRIMDLDDSNTVSELDATAILNVIGGDDAIRFYNTLS